MSATQPLELAPRRRWWTVPGLRATGVTGRISAAVILLAVVVAVLGPVLAPHDPDAVDLKFAYVGRYQDHYLGFDAQGRDVLSRLLVGARTSLLGPFIVVVLAIVLGTVIGVATAWRGGRFDSFVAGALDVWFAFPAIVLAIVATVIWGAGLRSASIALAVAYTPYVARVVRGSARRERAAEYVAALEVHGVAAWAICVRHIVGNLASLLTAQAAVLFAYAMVDLAAISFIGLGVQAPQSDWGVMVATGQSGVLQGFPMEAASAGVCIVVVVIAVNLLGERLTERAERVQR